MYSLGKKKKREDDTWITAAQCFSALHDEMRMEKLFIIYYLKRQITFRAEYNEMQSGVTESRAEMIDVDDED
jgi:hypothetical protein